MTHKQTIAIYRNRRLGSYRIQTFGRLMNGSSQPFGELVELPADVTDQELLKELLDGLSKNNAQVFDKELLPNISDLEWRRRLKEDQLVEVECISGAYRLIPSRKLKNSFGSIDDMIMVVSEEDFATSGSKIVRQLFSDMP